MNRFETLKKVFIRTLVVSLISAAAVAVITVLLGQLSDILWRSLMTLGLVAAHALASLFYIRTAEQSKDAEELTFFSNSVFILIILSFITSIFGTWQIINGELMGKLYLTYFVLLFAVLHGELLSKTTKLELYIDRIVAANYGFMLLVIGMLLPIIYLSQVTFDGLYYRGLAAAGIIDATLTILAVIFHKLYLQKHPLVLSQLFSVNSGQLDANGQPIPVAVGIPKRHTNPLLLLLGIYIIGQMVVSLIFAVSGGLFGSK